LQPFYTKLRITCDVKRWDTTKIVLLIKTIFD
jgi:hypothetical protein